jgi:hypothetical protein
MQIPRWLKVQRLGLFLFLFCAVLLLIYALGFISDVYLFYAYGGKALSDFYRVMQGINAGLLRNAILFIIFAVVLFILGLGTYPAGLFTLIIAALISTASSFLGVNALLRLLAARQEYTGLDLSSLNRYIERGAIQYHYSTFTYDIGMGIYGLFFCSLVFMIVSVMRNSFTVRAVTQKKESI